MTAASNPPNGGGRRRPDLRRRLEPQPGDRVAAALPRVHLDLAPGGRPVAIFRADARLFGADRPDPPGAAEQRAQPVDGGEEVAAVLLHHRQQEIAAGVAAQPLVLEHRQPRQQHAPGLALVARQRECALEHVAWRQHAQLVAQLTGAPAAVEHRHDGVDLKPRVGLQPAEQTRQPRAAAEAPDVQSAQLHRRPFHRRTRRLSIKGCRGGCEAPREDSRGIMNGWTLRCRR